MDLSLDHVVIHVSDWERSNAFYRDVLGAELVERDGGSARHYRFGQQQLNVHGPGQDPSPVAARPASPGGADLCFGGAARSRRRPAIWKTTGWRRRSARWSATAPAAGPPASTSAIPTAASSSSCRIQGPVLGLITDQVSPPPRIVKGTRLLATASVAVIAGADAVIRFRPPRWILIAAFDHPAHLATAALIALNAPPRSRSWHAGFMAGALLPDADHIPLALAEEKPGNDGFAPVHALRRGRGAAVRPWPEPRGAT